jgi:sphingoid base N-palmitoyltransferase
VDTLFLALSVLPLSSLYRRLLMVACACVHTYASQGITDGLFVLFAVSFGVSRLGVYPLWIVKSTLTDAHVIIGGGYPGMYIFYVMLLILQLLHIFW